MSIYVRHRTALNEFFFCSLSNLGLTILIILCGAQNEHEEVDFIYSS